MQMTAHGKRFAFEPLHPGTFNDFSCDTAGQPPAPAGGPRPFRDCKKGVAGQKESPNKRKHVFRYRILFFILLSLTLVHSGFCQSISLSLKGVALEKAFKEIESKIDQRFVYTRDMMDQSHAVTIHVKKAPLQTVLDVLFKDQPLDFSIDEQFIKVRFKAKPVTTAPNFINVQGRVLDESGGALANVSVIAKHSGKFAVTDGDGGYLLQQVMPNDKIVFSSVGYLEKEVAVDGRPRIDIQLSVSVSELDKALVIAYGVTTKRFNTGNVAKVSGEEIAQQPVSNPLAALEGRVPGLLISQASGVPGSGFKVEIRGRTSLDFSLSRNNPLFLIDGIPFEAGNVPMDQLVSAARNPLSVSQGGLSPLSILSAEDIESIEVLKDADATAIYGSRGANGVILITTRKGKPGKAKINLDFQYGMSKVGRTMDMLNTAQYVQMRKEAFQNEGVTMTKSNAPDLLFWDTTRYTDFKKLLIGNTAHYLNSAVSLSGGNSTTQFLLKAGYYRETNVFSNALSFSRKSVALNLNHNTADQRFNLVLQAGFNTTTNYLVATDLTKFINAIPNLLLYDSLGNLNWRENGVNFSSVNSSINPLAELRKKYTATNDNLMVNLSAHYKLLRDVLIRFTTGFNGNLLDEKSSVPKTAIATNQSTLASAKFASSQLKNWIIEPQLEYNRRFGPSRLNILLGSTWQENTSQGYSVNGSNYTNDLLLNSIAAAGAITGSNFYSQYRYAALFGRINYRLFDKYLINFSARRDGSTRFGPERRFANFGAVGTGWIFSSERFIQKHLSFLSYGKLRASYGLTGNDQIGDYRYLDLWDNTFLTYQGLPGLMPSAIFNPEYEWERNKKLEAALEAGFLEDRILFTASWYRNRSGNQLVNYKLPNQTGFTTVIQNLPALVENTGWELVAEYKTPSAKKLGWASAFTISLPRNRLVSFPGLASSTYSSSFVEGKSLSIVRGYRYLGVDPQTGMYAFEDVNKDGKFKTDDDFQVLGKTDPDFYGGFQNNIKYGNWQLGCFIQFTRQTGTNYLKELSTYQPGNLSNQPVLVLDRWQAPGDMAPIQRFAPLSSSSAAVMARTLLPLSNASYSDASFARLKNVSLSYELPAKLVRELKLREAKVFANAENLLTVTKYRGSDPETQNFYRLPPLKTIVAGIHLGF